MIVAVPPVPVASLGDHDFLPRGLLLLLGQFVGIRGNVFLDRLTYFKKVIPGLVILLVAEPDSEIMVDPASSEETRQRLCRRKFADKIADSRRPNRFRFGKQLI